PHYLRAGRVRLRRLKEVDLLTVRSIRGGLAFLKHRMMHQLLQLIRQQANVRLAQSHLVRAGNHANINTALRQPSPTQIPTGNAVPRLLENSEDGYAPAICLWFEIISRKIDSAQRAVRETSI